MCRARFDLREAYPKDKGAQAEVVALHIAVQTRDGSADSRNFAERNVKRSGLSRSVILARERNERAFALITTTLCRRSMTRMSNIGNPHDFSSRAGRKCEPAALRVRLTGCGIATILAWTVQRAVKTTTRPVNVPGESGEAWRLPAIAIRRAGVRSVAPRTMA
jgi:hypothetical protein